MSEEETKAVLDIFSSSGVSELASGQAVTVKSLLDQLDLIRAQGFALASGERFTGVCGVSAPIFNHTQSVIACISVSGPETRFERERALHYSSLILEKARNISSIMGAKTGTGPDNGNVAASASVIPADAVLER
jgi:DNA-binding IclR family transcriptional regulator